MASFAAKHLAADQREPEGTPPMSLVPAPPRHHATLSERFNDKNLQFWPKWDLPRVSTFPRARGECRWIAVEELLARIISNAWAAFAIPALILLACSELGFRLSPCVARQERAQRHAHRVVRPSSAVGTSTCKKLRPT